MSNPEASSNKIPLGTTIKNRYLVKKLLGQGGLGRTYLAVDTHRFNEPCVIKEFAPVGARQYDLEKSRELFIRESRILHQLSHVQIPKFLACFEDGGKLLLIQEYVSGKTYSALLERRKKNKKVFSEAEIVKWLSSLLPVFSYIHRQNILHRDISPDNIMQSEGKTLPVLIDFGVGKLSNDPANNSDSYIGQMSFVGKIGYAPREQVTMGICSPSSDLYGLGVTALVLLTGKDPTHLLDRYSLEWRWDKYAKVSPAFKKILDTMTEEIPQQRYQSAQEALRDIEKNLLDRETFIHPQPDINSTSMRSRNTSQQERPQKQIVPESTVIFNNENINSTKSNSSQSSSRRPKQEETMIIGNVDLDSLSSQSSSRRPKQEETMIISNVDADSLPSQSSSRKTKQEETMIISNVDADSLPSSNIYPTQKHHPISSTQTRLIDLDNLDDKISSSSQPKMEETVIFSNANSEPSASKNTVKSSQNSSLYPIQSKKLSSQFVRLCRQQLNEYMGAVADTIVDEILIHNAPKTPQALVSAIATKIPNSYQAQQFKQKLWRKLQSQ